MRSVNCASMSTNISIHRPVGRPRVADNPLIGTSVRLTQDELDFLDLVRSEIDAQSRNEALRFLINQARERGR